jgi:mycothiol synthase
MMPFTFRHFEPDVDLSRVAHLYDEVEASDQEGRDVTEARLRRQMGSAGHDPEQDCWVVESPGDTNQLIAFAGVWKAPGGDRADIDIVVHPDWRQKGIGRILIGRVLVRARTLGAAQAGVYVDSRNHASQAFLKEHNFLPVSAYTLMRAPGTVPLAPADWPPGFSVHTYSEIRQAPVLMEAMNSSYDGLWGHNVVTEDELAKWLLDWPLDGIFLAFDSGGEIAGVCRAEISRRLSEERGQLTGYIDAPGIVHWRRRQGLYVPLLQTALHYLKSQKAALIELESWGDEDSTLASYEQAGLTIVRRSISYRLMLR